MQDIIGFGGGGGKGGGGGSTRTPVESPDSLRSKAIARVLDLVSEGEVEGLVNGLQSVYLDDTPIQNADGSYNFNGVTIATRNGTQSQSYIPGFPSVENEVAVDVEVKVTQPVVRAIANLSVNAVRVRIVIPQLTYQDPSTGDLGGTSVQYVIDTQPNGGAWTEVVNQTTNGKTTSRYERQHRVELTGTGPWNIRVRRITADSTNSKLQNKTYLASYTEIVDAKLRYPNSALVALTVDSAQFRSIPRRGYLMKLLRIKVPTNYDPVARTYSGIWDGSFKIAWSDNPAWCFYDLLTNARYGLGDYLATSQIDKWSLYKIAQYCDGQVPNGFGGYEPRFTCNMYLQTRAEAYNVLQNMASVFRGMLYWQQGSITTVQDAPEDAVYLYTNANVIDGLFTYSGSSRKARHTVALVTWNDPADNYKSKVEYVEDVEGIKRFGVVQAEVTAVGCTSRGQANRVGKWILYSERMETEIVEFKTGLDGVIARPGQVIKIADQDKAGARIGGRLVGVASASSLTLDAPITMVSGATYYLSIVTPDGKVEERQLISSSGTFTNVTASTAFSFTPTTQTIWVMKSSVLEPAYFRVLSVAEGDKNTYAITAVAHEPSKFGAIENDLKLETRTTSILSAVPGKIATVNVSEYLYIAQGDVRTMMTVSWQAPTQAARYSVEYRKTNGGNWVMLPDTMSTSVDIPDVQVGSYQVRVRAISVVGLYGQYSNTITYLVLGKTTPPADVGNLTLTESNSGVLAAWAPCPDVDYDHTELAWSSSFATIIDAKRATTHGLGWLAAGLRTLYARHVDTSGNLSATVATTSLTVQAPRPVQITRADVQANTVALGWADAVGSQPVKSYAMYTGLVGDAFASCTLFGKAGADSRSDIVVFRSGGAKRIYLVAEDVAGNASAPVYVDVNVSLPNNYTLAANFVADWYGTKTNARYDEARGGLVMGQRSETWAQHFTRQGITTAAGQVAAGYPLVFQPGETISSYVQTFDLGKVLPSMRFTVIQQFVQISGSFTPQIQLDASTDGSTWTNGTLGVSDAQLRNVRYVRVTLQQTGTGGDDLVCVQKLQVTAGVEELSESAFITLNAADAVGTAYTTTKGFFDVVSATFTPAPATLGGSTSIVRWNVYIDDSGAPSTAAKVYVQAWDSSNARVSGRGSLQINGY